MRHPSYEGNETDGTVRNNNKDEYESDETQIMQTAALHGQSWDNRAGPVDQGRHHRLQV